MKIVKKIPVVTFIILALNVFGMYYEQANGLNRVIYRYGMYCGAIENGELFRVFTSAFLHFDFAHLLCNMFCLVSFGFALEKQIGPVKFGLVYLAAIIGAGVLIEVWGGPRSIHAGASGAVWGLMTATVAYSLRNGTNPASALRCILLNLVYSFSAGVSWQAHIGGGIGGLLLALVLFRKKELAGYFEPGSEEPYENPWAK